jgi:hypothetical protein
VKLHYNFPFSFMAEAIMHGPPPAFDRGPAAPVQDESRFKFESESQAESPAQGLESGTGHCLPPVSEELLRNS